MFMSQCLSKMLFVTQINGESLGFETYFKTALQSEEETLISIDRKMVKQGCVGVMPLLFWRLFLFG